MEKIVLVIVFNHRFDKNIEKLKNLYRERFSNIIFLMPFYTGSDKTVVSVYSSSFCFQGFFSQSFEKLKSLNGDYYLFIGDDLILNPKVNENNCKEILKLQSLKDSYIPRINSFNPSTTWSHARRSMDFVIKSPYYDISNELPCYADALELLKSSGVEPKGLVFSKVYSKRHRESMLHQQSDDNYLFPTYPLCWGYSDIFCIGSMNLEKFVHYCGLFSSAQLFVEIAIPTSIVLSTNGKIIQEKDISLSGKALWGKEQRERELAIYNFSIKKLLEEFPNNQLFYHPVKLSQWSDI